MDLLSRCLRIRCAGPGCRRHHLLSAARNQKGPARKPGRAGFSNVGELTRMRPAATRRLANKLPPVHFRPLGVPTISPSHALGLRRNIAGRLTKTRTVLAAGSGSPPAPGFAPHNQTWLTGMARRSELGYFCAHLVLGLVTGWFCGFFGNNQVIETRRTPSRAGGWVSEAQCAMPRSRLPGSSQEVVGDCCISKSSRAITLARRLRHELKVLGELPAVRPPSPLDCRPRRSSRSGPCRRAGARGQ
jgi:hypothetical protein